MVKKISVVIPVYNEKKNIRILSDELENVLEELNFGYEVIYINDGSQDNTLKEIKKVSRKRNNFKYISFKKNKGQSLALNAGFRKASGDLIVTMDGDLQNDPKDIPKLIKKINKGYDVVVGWRYDRKDPFFSKKIPAFFSNILIRTISGLKIHDCGCTLKIFKKKVVNDLKLEDGMHRFIPTICQKKCYKIGEIKVNHRQRKFGESKYGLSRMGKGIKDLLYIKYFN